MVIHTIGDSHSHNGFARIPGIMIHHIGAKLCFSIGRDGFIIKDEYNHYRKTL